MNIADIPNRVHFVGIGGIGQSALAKHLLLSGHKVSGSDGTDGKMLAKLADLGACFHVGHNADNVADAQLVVKSSAVGDDNVEVAYARQQGIPVVLREQLLGAIFNDYSVRIAVCGTHGKTTVTAMISHVLAECGVEHAAFIGGKFHGENYRYGKNVVVAEACEYNRSFLQLRPTITVCLNCQLDHTDCYADVADVEAAFEQLAQQTSGCFICPQGLLHMFPNAVAFDDGRLKISNLKSINGKPCFDLSCDNVTIRSCRLRICGTHNVANLLAALTVARVIGMPLLQASRAACLFDGVDRRWTEKQSFCRVVCDYAHHPTELRAAIKCARELADDVVCVFQPHTYSRTKAFFVQFAECFAQTRVIYLPIFAARETPIDGVSSQALAEYARSIGVDACYAQGFDEADMLVREKADRCSVVLILGAGDVYKLFERF